MTFDAAENITVEEGMISFWIKEHAVTFNDGQTHELVQLDPVGGSISITKDADNRLKCYFIALGKGRAQLEYDVSSLDPKERHSVALGWVADGEIALYLDGDEVATEVFPVAE